MAFKIYTKTGDLGETSLFGGRRLPKNHIRIESYGTIDELNSWIGLLRDHLTNEEQRSLLKDVQDRLFTIGSNLASDPEKDLPIPDINKEDIHQLEKAIDKMEESLPPLKNFILPGGHPIVSYAHLARCVCRRAERLVVSVSLSEKVDPVLIRYLNRLSDMLFVMARFIARELDAKEIIWKSRS